MDPAVAQEITSLHKYVWDDLKSLTFVSTSWLLRSSLWTLLSSGTYSPHWISPHCQKRQKGRKHGSISLVHPLCLQHPVAGDRLAVPGMLLGVRSRTTEVQPTNSMSVASRKDRPSTYAAPLPARSAWHNTGSLACIALASLSKEPSLLQASHQSTSDSLLTSYGY